MTRDELLQRYVTCSTRLHEQDQYERPDIAERCLAKYGAADAAEALRRRFDVEVERVVGKRV